MGILIKTAELIMELNNRGLFKSLDSVLDMGDQNFTLSKNEIVNLFKKYDVIIDGDLVEAIDKKKNYISSSFFWKHLGFKNCDRLDMFFENRDEKLDPVNNKINHDLNFLPKDLRNKYNLVTDFGNNEHAFNVSNAYETMHELCNKDGIIFVEQQLLFSNGFYNFTPDFFENLAAFNNYEINFSSLIFKLDNDRHIYTEPDLSFIKKIKLDNVNEIAITYVFRKKEDQKFRIPYQRIKPPYSKTLPFYDFNFQKKNYPFEREYLYKDITKIKVGKLIAIILYKIARRVKSFFGK